MTSLAENIPDNAPIQMICCLCHRLKGEHGWHHQPLPEVGHLSHGYCPECFREVERELAELELRYH